MTKTTVRYENRKAWQTYTLICMGHAGYAKEGDDIVCAAVSILAYTLHNYLHNLGAGKMMFRVEEEKGFLYLEYTNQGKVDPKALHAFDVVKTGLETLAEAYPLNVNCKVDVI